MKEKVRTFVSAVGHDDVGKDDCVLGIHTLKPKQQTKHTFENKYHANQTRTRGAALYLRNPGLG
jgi:hypothetical protein